MTFPVERAEEQEGLASGMTYVLNVREMEGSSVPAELGRARDATAQANQID